MCPAALAASTQAQKVMGLVGSTHRCTARHDLRQCSSPCSSTQGLVSTDHMPLGCTRSGKASAPPARPERSSRAHILMRWSLRKDERCWSRCIGSTRWSRCIGSSLELQRVVAIRRRRTVRLEHLIVRPPLMIQVDRVGVLPTSTTGLPPCQCPTPEHHFDSYICARQSYTFDVAPGAWTSHVSAPYFDGEARQVMHQFLDRVESRVTDTNIDGYSNQTSAQGHGAAPCMVMIRPCIKQRRHAMEVAVVICRLRPGTYTTRNQPLPDKTTVNHSPTHTCTNASAGATPSTRDSEAIDGRNYREPRPPFAGTLWNGRVNAFVRVDQENRRRPGGMRPQGYIWIESILGYRRTRLHTDADEERVNKIQRNNQRPRGTQSNVLFGQAIPKASLLEITW